MMVLALDPTAAWPQGHISGPDNGKVDYPIRLYGLVLDGVDLAAFSGQIFIGEVTVGGAPTYTPSPSATPIIPAPTSTR